MTDEPSIPTQAVVEGAAEIVEQAANAIEKGVKRVEQIINGHGQIFDPQVYGSNADGTPATDSVGHFIKKENFYQRPASNWPGEK